MSERTRVHGATRSSALVGRLAVRAARNSVRRRGRSRWWRVDVLGSDDLRLTPVQPADAWSWHHLVTTCGARPPATGVGASPLGGAATDTVDWTVRCLDLRASARRGEAYCYLVRDQGTLVGEALGFVDLGTSAVELAVWLAPTDHGGAATRTAGCIDLLAAHVLAAPDPPRRATCSVSNDEPSVLACLVALDFVVEGELSDPPHPNRTVVAKTREPGVRSETP